MSAPPPPPSLGTKRPIETSESESKGGAEKKSKLLDTTSSTSTPTPTPGGDNGGEGSSTASVAAGDVAGKKKRKPKRKVVLYCGYDGAGYHGVQLQTTGEDREQTAVTIEGVLLEALHAAGAISDDNAGDVKKIGWQRSGRTDKGVSAMGMLFSAKLSLPIADDEGSIPDATNPFLPDTIRLYKSHRINRSFSARYDCSSRHYEYVLPAFALDPANFRRLCLTQGVREEPPPVLGFKELKELAQNPTTMTLDGLPEALKNPGIDMTHVNTLRKLMAYFEGTKSYHNFTNGKKKGDMSAQRHIKSITVSDPFVIDGLQVVSIALHGDSFLLHMIRRMIGFAVLLQRHMPSPELNPELFEFIDNVHTAQSHPVPRAPGNGLFLDHGNYSAYNSPENQRRHANGVVWDSIRPQMELFREQFIYPGIASRETVGIELPFFKFLARYDWLVEYYGSDLSASTVRDPDRVFSESWYSHQLQARGLSLGDNSATA